MSQPWDETSAGVAAEAEHERADLAQTLDKLRENLQPRNVVDEVMSHAGVNPANVSDQLATFARMNPVAAALIGIGAAMFLGTKRGGGTARVAGATPTVAGRYPSGATSDPRLNPEERRDIPGRYDRFAEPEYRDIDAPYAADLPDVAPLSPEPRPAMNAVTILRHPQSSLWRLIDEQPLVIAALGVAVGAVIGAALPPTTIESQLMGDANEAMRRNANAAARAQLAQIRTTATNTFEQMKTTVAEHGATSENLYGLVHDLGDDVRAASQSIGPRPRA